MQSSNSRQQYIAFQSKGCIDLCSYELVFDPMTFILDLDLLAHVLKMYLHTENEASRPRHQQVIGQTGTQACAFLAPVTLTLPW